MKHDGGFFNQLCQLECSLSLVSSISFFALKYVSWSQRDDNMPWHNCLHTQYTQYTQYMYTIYTTTYTWHRTHRKRSSLGSLPSFPSYVLMTWIPRATVPEHWDPSSLIWAAKQCSSTRTYTECFLKLQVRVAHNRTEFAVGNVIYVMNESLN